MIARWIFLLLLLLAGGAAAQSGGAPQRGWLAIRIDPEVVWPRAVARPRAIVAPLDPQMMVSVDVLCYSLTNGPELRLLYGDSQLIGEHNRQPDLPARIDNDTPVRMIWAGRGEWLSDPLPPSFAERMRNGSNIIVEWGVYAPVRRGDPLRLHLRGAAAAIDALLAICR